MSQHADPVESCAICPVGRAAGVRFGGRCPLVGRRHEPRATLYVEGEPVHHVWFVTRGGGLLARAGGDADSPRAVRGPGAFVGLEALVRGTYRASAHVEGRAILCGGSRDDVDAWLGAPGLPARAVLEQVLRADAADPVRGAAADGTALRRVARWLLDADALELSLSRDRVAGLLGMVPETLSRVLARLRARGAIAATRRSITIVDREALEETAR